MGRRSGFDEQCLGQRGIHGEAVDETAADDGPGCPRLDGAVGDAEDVGHRSQCVGIDIDDAIGDATVDDLPVAPNNDAREVTTRAECAYLCPILLVEGVMQPSS